MKITSVYPTQVESRYELRFLDEDGNEHTPEEIPGLHEDYLASFASAEEANAAAYAYVAETGCGYTADAFGGPTIAE